jgi:para-aminobenzoate synthetase component 1
VDARAIVRDGNEWILCEDPVETVVARGADAFEALDVMAQSGFWVGFCAYDLGRAVEHVEARAVDDVGLPDLAFVRYATVARVRSLPPMNGGVVALGAGGSSLDEAAHAAAVSVIHELLRDGECYQVNLTRRLVFDNAPDPFALFDVVQRTNPSPYALVATVPGAAIVSASPELFLRVVGRAVETRPIKGTALERAELATSAKDHAENVMIVDLARNDLGRVCNYGSVHVAALCEIEDHPGLHHLVSTVRGELRDGVGLGDLVRATFPPASVTGAPKPRVLQAIEDLEPVRRGVYCGAVGWIDGDRERASLAVAIRTFTIVGGHTYFGVGGGIVADSTAAGEWAETELKGARLLNAAGGGYAREPARAR